MIIIKNAKKVKKVIAFGLISLGISASLINNFVSKKLCIFCVPEDKTIMVFLFLFVEIIFVVCGASLLTLENHPVEISSK